MNQLDARIEALLWIAIVIALFCGMILIGLETGVLIPTS